MVSHAWETLPTQPSRFNQVYGSSTNGALPYVIALKTTTAYEGCSFNGIQLNTVHLGRFHMMNLTLRTVQTLSILTAVATVVAMATAPAHALTFTTTLGSTSLESGVTNVTFDSAPSGTITPSYTEGLATYTGGAIVKNGSSGQYAPPAPNNGTNYLTLGGTVPSASSPVEINFAKALNYFGLHWGSVDAYNEISFFKGLTQVGSTYTGTNILTGANGDQTPPGSRYVNFFADSGESFNRIVLTSSAPAFESDNHAYRAIPTPALLPGLIALGVGVMRKRKGETAAESEA